jgi:regulator of sigma E protease
LGEDQSSTAEGDTRSFANRSAVDRFLVLVAGVVMNLILAYVLFSVGHGIGIPSVVESGDNNNTAVVRVVEVVDNSPAIQAGVAVGDALIKLKSPHETVFATEVIDVQNFVQEHAGQQVTIVVTRSGVEKELTVLLRQSAPPGEGILGIAMVKVGIVSVPWYRAPWEGLKTTLSAVKTITVGLVAFFANIFRADVAGTVAGPIGIAQIAGEASTLGFVYLLQLVAILSINLAILNILPIPALDGGRVLFLIIEKLRGRPVSMQISQFAHTAGFIILILLMLIVTYFDLARIF